MRNQSTEGLTTGTVVDPGVGQLPDPHIAWPISERRFRRLAQYWRSSNLWLSLWNRDGEMVAADDEAGPFFKTLASRPNAFCKVLAELVRSKADNATTAPDDDMVAEPGLSPWPDDIGLIVVPIMARLRTIGAVVGASVLTPQPGEDFTRLCHQCGLDREAMIGFLTQTSAQRREEFSALSGPLTLSVDQAREIEVGQSELSILTDNLQHSYEELHLIYEISRQMDIPRKPTEMLQEVGRETLEVSRAAGIAFVLEAPDSSQDTPIASASQLHEGRKQAADLPTVVKPCQANENDSLLERIVQVGNGPADLKDLLRLTDVLKPVTDSGPGYLLINGVTQRSDLRWASRWLKHLVVLPLRQENQLMGVLYAINCVDERDFTWVDIQLLRAVADRVTATLQNQHLLRDLTDLLMGFLFALVNSVDAKDPYTFGHSERVAYFSRCLAQEIEMTPAACERVYLAGLLHDVGKIGVPDAILSKPGKLTKEEFDLLKKHPEIGEYILSHVRQIRDLLPGVLYHHERMDGRGYPHRLAGMDIPLLGRIICLADSFDAMTTNRTYRAALPIPLAISEIRRCAGNQFDPVLAERFLRLDPERLYHEAHRQSGGDLNIGRSGVLLTSLDSVSRPQGCLGGSACGSTGSVAGATGA